MKVLIIEDEAPAARRLKQLILETDPFIEVLDIIDSVESAVKWLQIHKMPDIIFMDIQLADGISFDIFDQVPIKAPVIFTTAYDEYAIRAFQVNSIDYLLKPINKEALQKSILKLQEMKAAFGSPQPEQEIEAILQSLHLSKKSYKSRFLVKLGEKLISINTADIAYFIADEKIVILFTKEGKKYPVDYSLDELEGLLDPELFFRINRQYIIQVSAITAIHTYFNGKLKLQLQPEAVKEAIISKEKAPVFKKWLDR